MAENHPTSQHRYKKTVLATAFTAALGVSAMASADQVSGTMTGFFTLGSAAGDAQINIDSPDPDGIPGLGSQRTPINGSFSYDIAAGTGSLTIAPFSFFGGGFASATTISFKDIGDGSGGPGTLLGASMGFNWNNNFGIPVTDVFDGAGFLNAITPGFTGTISTGCTGCATSTTADAAIGSPAVIGAVPMGMTNYNTAGTTLDSLLPLVDDGIAGSPMTTPPFAGFHALFDLTDMDVVTYTDTTPPDLTMNVFPATGETSPVNLNVGDTYTEPGATCNDAVDGSLTPAIGGDTVDTNAIGVYNVTYNCQDNSGNDAPQKTRSVNVTITGTPIIDLLGSNPVTHEAATTYTDAGATCNDGAGSDIPLPTDNPPEFFGVTSAPVDVDAPGNYPVTYECTNSSSASATPVTRDVNVVDTTPPVITLDPNCDSGITVIGGPAIPDPTPMASCIDTVDGDLTNQIEQSGDTADPNPDFGSDLSVFYNLGFSCTDAASNNSFKGCEITVGNPDPVATLVGDVTVVIASGSDYTEEGATCEDLTDGALPDAVADMVIDETTPTGNYTITYTCGPNTLGNTGTTTRKVLIGVAFSAAADSGSNFVMIDPGNSFVGGADDVFFSWDGSLYTDPETQTAANIFMNSAEPQPFFGFPWDAHDIRAFGPGDYVIPTSRGNTLDLHIEPNQIGAHMLFDWNENNDIDVVLTWDINGVFVGSGGAADDLGAKGQSFGLAVIDADGDGISGTPMVDGPFAGFNANFNIKLTPLFALPDANASAAQDAFDPITVISSVGGDVTVSTAVNPNVNGVFSYGQTGFSYDWSLSDAALLAANTNGTTNSTFVFNPAGLPEGATSTVVKVVDNTTGLTATAVVPLQVTSGPADGDNDADGIPDSQDSLDNNAFPSMQQTESGNGTSFIMESSTGKLVMGDAAIAAGVQSGTYQAAITATDIPVKDDVVANSCVGGCFSFKVTGLTSGSAVDVVLPLSLGLPDVSRVRKFINQTWRDFDTSGDNAIMYAGGSAGNCPGPNDSGWSGTPEADDFCLKLTIVDGGPNDTDANANGTVVDPVGVGGGTGSAGGGGQIPGDVGNPSKGGGCSLTDTDVTAGKRADWWLFAGVLVALGVTRRRRQKLN